MNNSIKRVIKTISVAFFISLSWMSHATDIAPDIKDKVSISVNDMPMPQFFAEVENMSNYSFFYSDTVLKGIPNVSISVQDMLIDQLLREVFKGTNLVFEVIGNKIAIKMTRTTTNVRGGGQCCNCF